MNRYDMPIPRALFGTAAVAMTAITVALGVVLPAVLGSGAHDASVVLAVDKVIVTDTGTAPLRVDVVGRCEQQMASERARAVSREHQQRT